ncbi:MAG: hypothetical protein AAGF32_07605 [Pseudomonadota bacterium]
MARLVRVEPWLRYIEKHGIPRLRGELDDLSSNSRRMARRAIAMAEAHQATEQERTRVPWIGVPLGYRPEPNYDGSTNTLLLAIGLLITGGALFYGIASSGAGPLL